MIVKDRRSVETEEIDGGVDFAGFQGASDLTNDEARVVRGRRRR